jgi:predicted RNase H-like nuclease
MMSHRKPANLIGIDGCRAGWVCATAPADLATTTITIEQDLTAVFSGAARDGDLVVIDIPIGLAAREPRGCDLAARSYLQGPRKSSVFPAPCQGTITATTYEEACELNRRACGKAVSKQLFAILPRIRDVDNLMRPDMQRWIREGHPEVTFAALAGSGTGPLPNKREAEGQLQRLALIRGYIRDVDRLGVDEQRRRLGPGKVSADDLIDAITCLITAFRIMTNTAFSFPKDQDERNARGLRMEIIA